MLKIKIKFLNLTEFLSVLFIILECESVYKHAITINFHIKEIGGILLALLLFLNILYNRISLSLLYFYMQRMILYFGFVIIFGIFRAAANVDGYILRFVIINPILIFICLIYSNNRDIYRLLDYFCKIMSIISCISLIFWILGSQLHILSPNVNLLVNWGVDYYYPSYYFIHFERQKQKLWFFSGLRNHAIFTESPMFSLLLVIAMGMKIYILPQYHIGTYQFDSRKKIFNAQTILMTLAILSSVSTTGIILLLLELVVIYVLQRPKDKLIQIAKFGTNIIFIISGIVLAWQVFNYKSSTTISWIDRIDGFNVSITAMMLDPLFGNGFADSSAVKELFLNGRGFTNSLSTILYQGGISLSVFLLFPLFRYINLGIRYNNKYKIIFSLLVLLELIFVMWQYTYFMFFLLAFFYAESRQNLRSSIYKEKQ